MNTFDGTDRVYLCASIRRRGKSRMTADFEAADESSSSPDSCWCEIDANDRVIE